MEEEVKVVGIFVFFYKRFFDEEVKNISGNFF